MEVDASTTLDTSGAADQEVNVCLLSRYAGDISDVDFAEGLELGELAASIGLDINEFLHAALGDDQAAGSARQAAGISG